MKRRILIVDDDAAVRASLKKVLEGAGHEVVLAASGTEATFWFEPRRTSLLLLDLDLPDQSGWDLFERLTTRDPTLPVIVITGLPGQREMAEAAGVGALFEKPVETAVLLQRIDELMAEPFERRVKRIYGELDDTIYVRGARYSGCTPGEVGGDPGAMNTGQLSVDAEKTGAMG